MRLLPIFSLLAATVSLVTATPTLTRRACGKVGSFRCLDDTIQKCNQYHNWETNTVCPSPLTCIEPREGFAFCGKKGTKPPSLRSATPAHESCETTNKFRCAGQTIERCNEEHVWECGVTCSEPFSCVEHNSYAFCSIKTMSTPSATSATQPLKHTPAPEEFCLIKQSTRCGGQFKNTVQQCGSDNRWHSIQECASDQVCSFHNNRAQCDWAKRRDTSLEEREVKRDFLGFCNAPQATRCHKNTIEYCDPNGFQWQYQSLCWPHDHQRCKQYGIHAVCETWGKRESTDFIEGQEKPQEEKREVEIVEEEEE